MVTSGHNNIIIITAALAAFAAMAPAMASAQSDGMMGEEASFDALNEPRWITTTTTESGSTYALVASFLDNAVQVINVTDPANPMPVASLRDGVDGFEALGGGNVVAVTTISGSTYALVAGYLDHAVQVINVTDPANPMPVASLRDGVDGFEALAGPFDIGIVTTSETTYVLVASLLDSAIQVIDMGDPTSPVPVAVIQDGVDGFEELAAAISLAIVSTQDSTYALVASFEDDGIQVIDVTDPTAPLPAGAIVDGENGFDLVKPSHIDIATISDRTYALVTSYARSYVLIIDVTDPTAPSSVTIMRDDQDGFEALQTVSRVEVVAASGSTYVLASGYGDDAIQVIDVTDPADPLPAGVLADGEDGFDALEGASSMTTITASNRTYVLVASYLDDAVQVIDVTDPSAPAAVTAVYDVQDAPVLDLGVADSAVDPLTIPDRFDIGDIEARVVSEVTDAVLRYSVHGDDYFKAIGVQARHVPGVFVFGADAGSVVAHNVDPDLEGIFRTTLSQADRPLEVILSDLSVNGGTWVNHMFPHPDTSIVQQKRSWLYEHDGYIFGSGYYLHDTRAQQLVEGAVDRYESDGAAAFDGVVSADGPSIFVHVNDTSGTLLHNAVQPYEQVIGELEVYGHAWISYISQNPGANTQQTTRMWLEMHDGHVFGSGYYLPDSRIQSQVEGARLLYQSNSEAAFEIITPEVPAHTDALYPFILNFNDSRTVAHGAFPDKLDKIPVTSLHQANRPWPQIQQEMIADGDAWASYVFTNPDTNTIQLKRTYLQLHDGYTFASGYYLPDARVQAVVDLAVASYRSIGEDSFEAIDRGTASGDDSLYATVLTQTGTTVASGAPTGFVENIDGLPVSGDRDSLTLHTDLVEDGSAWFELPTTNPATGTEQIKRSWLYLYDDLLFMSGYYIPESEAQSVVDRAVFLYVNEGDAAFDMITPEVPASTDALYPFVMDFDTSESVAHGAYPHLVGKAPTASLHQGEKTWPQIQEELLAHGGTWTSYVFANPDTSSDQDKRTWLYLHDGYVFAAGYYIRDSQVQAIVHNAILTYQADPDNAFAAIDALSEGAPTDTYPFVLNAATYVIEAHGANPDRNGNIGVALTKADRPAEDILADLEANRGTWSHYTFTNPLTDEEENKRAWLSLYDGYIFGSGYYDYAPSG